MTPDRWAAHLTRVLDGPVEERRARLATICLTADRVVRQSEARGSAVPEGRAPDDVVRRAAEVLEREATSDHEHVVALVFRRWKLGTAGQDDPGEWEDADAAFRLASIADPVLAVWVASTAVYRMSRALRHRAAAGFVERARALLDDPAVTSTGPYAAAEPLWRESADPDAARAVIEYFFWDAASRVHRDSGALHEWQSAIGRGIEAATALRSARPSLLVLALKRGAERDRALGDQADLSAFEELRDGRLSIESPYLAQLGYNARARGDRAAAMDAFQRRARLLLSQLPELADKAPAEIAEHFTGLPVSERRLSNALANTAYELAVELFDSGRTAESEVERALALDWLSVSRALWRDWGTNGVRAVAYREALIREELTGEHLDALLDITREAPRAGLRANVISSVATIPETPDPRVLVRLDEMLEEDWSARQRAVLLSARAWATRRGSPLEREASHEDALAALELLPARPSGSLATLARAAWVAADWAVGRDDVEAAAHYRDAVTLVGRMLLNATTTGQRLHLARTWSRLLRAALGHALRSQEHDLADLVAEVIRRDGVGTLLLELGTDPLSPTEAADAAIRASMAGTIDADDEDAAPGETTEPDGGEGDDLFRSSRRTYLRERDTASYRLAEQILGPVGSLADPATLYLSRAADLLGARPSQPVALLQLLPSLHPLLGDDEARVHRRLTWTDGDGVAEWHDVVPLPADALREGDPLGNALWSDASPFLPPPLLELLTSATAEQPIRLLVVPTGLFHIAFDGLRLGPGVHLLDRALTTVHTSLTAARHAARATPESDAVGSFAILDTERLRSTRRELEALRRWFPEVLTPGEPATLDALATHPRVRLMALGVHGDDEDGGWGQVKHLPGGLRLTAAQALRYRFPELCVLASCNSQVRLADGADLAGFPAALFARGARTVIGSIGLLPDGPTGDILALFYEELAASGNPVAALRAARLRWIAEDPLRRRAARGSWARLVVYGGSRFF